MSGCVRVSDRMSVRVQFDVDDDFDASTGRWIDHRMSGEGVLYA